MVRCPRCLNRPNECFRSRWYKQLVHVPILRIRWRCMRCGTTFTSWLWEPPPANDAFQRDSDADDAAVGQTQTADNDSLADSAKPQ